jgi:hypothetical protein
MQVLLKLVDQKVPKHLRIGRRHCLQLGVLGELQHHVFIVAAHRLTDVGQQLLNNSSLFSGEQRAVGSLSLSPDLALGAEVMTTRDHHVLLAERAFTSNAGDRIAAKNTAACGTERQTSVLTHASSG